MSVFKYMVSKIITRVERSMRMHICIFMCVCVKFSLVEQTITMFSTISNVLKKRFQMPLKRIVFQKIFYSLSFRL